jgi:sugar lactone lactonase YvrE
VSVLKDGKIEVFWARPGCGPAAVTRYQTSGFLVACYDANTVVQLSKMGRVEKVYRSSGTRSFKGPNDFSVDSKEGTYFTASGVFKISAPVEGEIHYLPPQGNLVRVASGIHYSNGIAVISQEGRGPKVLVSEHLKNRILSYAILKNGKLSRTSEVFYDLAKQLPARADSTQGLQGPDGMRLGADGIIYIAQYAASRIIKLRTDGTLVGQISIDSTFRNPTNVWLHDHKLYVSAYRETSSPDSSGIILMIDDPKISSRKNLNCSIRPNGQAE